MIYALLIEGADEEQRASVDQALEGSRGEGAHVRRQLAIAAAVAAGAGEIG